MNPASRTKPLSPRYRIEDLEPGRGMDELVHVHVLHKSLLTYEVMRKEAERVWKDQPTCSEFAGGFRAWPEKSGEIHCNQMFLPVLTSIAAAFGYVVAAMREHANPKYRNLAFVSYAYNRTYASFDVDALSDDSPELWLEANGEHSVTMAICSAALRAYGLV